jgi:hypothetical protein
VTGDAHTPVRRGSGHAAKCVGLGRAGRPHPGLPGRWPRCGTAACGRHPGRGQDQGEHGGPSSVPALGHSSSLSRAELPDNGARALAREGAGALGCWTR